MPTVVHVKERDVERVKVRDRCRQRDVEMKKRERE